VIFFKRKVVSKKLNFESDFHVDINGTVSALNTFHKSVIQGILGPTLFSIYINGLYTASNLFKLMFPNDTAGLAKDKSLNSLVDSKLKKIALWFRANKWP
jgi:hypothetical protein